jgi:hypothetical protein
LSVALVTTPTISTVSVPTVPALTQIARLPWPEPTWVGAPTLLITKGGAASADVLAASTEAPASHFAFLINPENV